ncbi:hypothetical protein I302_108730 [Kwoniella bestiolae CBS 10118]|uniref:Uncharacterized protein n=1 Tax=Kwoniella bestiolae CBS 10118 TaxID=1296100 RepID=A0A1B9FTY5_9TREE|nr:hypothetical protein I302_07867 [Kwoniella bestiolae CBS 10118]OCF22222.1 hypothetical protein I302_07867 [Kwoniella bestiolae CBS 10118]
MSTRSTTRQRTSSHPAHTHTPTPPLQRTSSRPGSSRPGTPSIASRGDIPISRKASSTTPHKSPIPLQHHQLPPVTMSEQPTTPTPKKPRRTRKGNKPSQQRNIVVGSEPEPDLCADQEPSSEDEEMLFDLLGVTSPPKASPKRGVLNLSKDDMDVALRKKARAPRNKARKESVTDHEGELGKHPRNENSPAPNSRKNGKNQRLRRSENNDERGVGSEGDVPQKGRGGKKGSKFSLDGASSSAHLQSGKDHNLPNKPKSSGLSNTKPKNLPKHQSTSQVPTTEDISYSAFDTSSLSKSLPARGLAQPQPQLSQSNNKKNGKKGNGSGDESAVWEMPSVAGGQELTWQQKLQSSTSASSHSNESSPRKSSKSTPSDKKKSNRCAPFQQQSALPAVSSPLNPRPAHNRRASVDGVPTASTPSGTTGTSGRTISAFDSHIPFHTGYNVHRAPQTPAKGVASAHGNLSDNILPIVGSGEFPRLRENSQQDLLQRKGSLTNQHSGSGSGSTAAFSAKYAGPTFHNSPNAASLSKPDLEDF